MIKQSNEMKVLKEFVKEFSPFHEQEADRMTYSELTEVVIEIAKEMKR